MHSESNNKDHGQMDSCGLMGDEAMAQGDYVKALECYAAGAAKGLAAAQHNLAHLYQEGKGVAIDFAEACKLYTQAAEQTWG